MSKKLVHMQIFLTLVFPSVNSEYVSYLSTAFTTNGLKAMFITLFSTLNNCFVKLFSSMMKNEITQLKET